MIPAARWRAVALGAALLAAFLGLQGGACGKGGTTGGPAPGSKEYAEALRAFYVGAAALQVGDTKRAAPELATASKMIPNEPAILADLGILALHNGQVDAAVDYVNQAAKIAPNDSRIVYLQGVLKSRKGDYAGAAADFQRAADLNPRDLRARFAVVEQVQRQGGPDADKKSLDLVRKMLESHPDNLVLILECARLAAKTGDSATLRSMVDRLGPLSAGWPDEPKKRLKDLQAAANGADPRAAIGAVMVLNNVLQPVAARQADYAQLHYPLPVPGEVGDPLLTLTTIPNPPATPAPSDEKLTFTATAPDQSVQKSLMATSAYLDPGRKPVVLSVDGKSLRVVGSSTTLPFPGGTSAPSTHAVCAADLFSGFHNDLILAGQGGLRIYKQDDRATFTDVTAKTKLPATVTSAPAYGVWAADVDLDGDLDLVESLADGRVQVLQNNADGTFKPTEVFSTIKNVRQFGWADMDGDDADDAVLLDSAGALHVFLNQRSNRFTESPMPAALGPVAAFTIMDVDDDGMLDIAALKQDGTLARVSHKADGAWTVAEFGKWPGSALPANDAPSTTRLFSADLDNNGGIDIVASTPTATAIWLHGEHGTYKPLAATPPGDITSADNMSGSGRLDLVGLAGAKPVVYENRGWEQYAWQELKPTAAYKSRGRDPNKVEPNERVNPFGIGGTMEIRAGLLSQKELITGPVVHFGLGRNSGVDVARIIWPNGVLQSEFAPVNPTVETSQRLSSSCPWIFAWDGRKMGFVTDFLWRSPLGLKINAQDTGAVAMTQDWVKIRGDQLVPKDGIYDLRITAELWETHFFDQVTLMAVDHPAGTEIFVDERFAIPPPKFGPYLTGPLHPFARATDDLGSDAGATVRDLDGKYLDTFGLGYFQGVTRDHYVELELPKDAPAAGPRWLVAQGWVHPTDSSLNVAMSQGSHDKPRGLSLEVPDGRGGWRVAKPNLGFPSGKTKTILVDLNGVFAPGTPRKVRLRTNLEVYWDRLAWAPGLPAAGVRTARILPSTAELRYHGYSPYHPGPVSSPEIPDYAEAERLPHQWSDLIGYCTRFGDVRELLEKVDDRYVIMNAGDEMALTFKVSPPPPAGWVRDFILMGDGWEKDGNLNTTWSKTVLPLPSHDNPLYNKPPGRLEDDPVYRRHPEDWVRYHTRFVTPRGFASALKPRENQ